MSFTPAPDAPLREVTPEMRRRSTRTFIGLMVTFLAVIGMLLAAMTWQGRAVRDYGQRVLQAAQASSPSPNVSYQVPCTEVHPEPLPANVLNCSVDIAGGKATVNLDLRGERRYQVR